MDTEQPDYDLDSDDEAFVIKLKKKMEISFLQFEEMIDRLEKGSGQQVGITFTWTWSALAKVNDCPVRTRKYFTEKFELLTTDVSHKQSCLTLTCVCAAQLVSLPEAKLLLKEDDELIKEVYEYWSRKRKCSRANALLNNIKQEKRDGSSTSDPYVAFRRRTEKMQTRKVGLLATPSKNPVISKQCYGLQHLLFPAKWSWSLIFTPKCFSTLHAVCLGFYFIIKLSLLPSRFYNGGRIKNCSKLKIKTVGLVKNWLCEEMLPLKVEMVVFYSVS